VPLPDLAQTETSAERRYYSKAPILEAALDIQLRLPATTTLNTLQDMQGSWGADYLLINDQQSSPSITTNTSLSSGVNFVSTDGRRSIQARRDGFAFAKRAPYERWEPYRDEARRCWELYRQVAQPLSITRVGLRYINNLELPRPVGDFRRYLRTVPEVSPALPAALTNFILQLQIPLPGIDGLLILNQGLIESSDPTKARVLLDINVFTHALISPQGDSILWDEMFEALHRQKNDVFEACITDETRELIS
jgi:uncharacterized protein (TIGR04255 family)